MRRYNDGMIYTNDKCVACAHCVHVCPAVGANVTANDNGRITIDVSDKNCIHCGSCIKECGHDARKFKDNLDDMLLDLKRGNDVSLIVDPAFVLAYGEKRARNIFGYLKSLGVKGIYDGSIGGDISIYLHARFLHENIHEEEKCDKYYAHICPGFSNYVSRYLPAALDRFIPVQLPAVCAAIYFRKYRGVTGRFALLSPCTAIFDEFSSYNSGRNINYLIGFSSIFDHIGDADISGYDAFFDDECGVSGSIFCENDAFSDVVAQYFPSNYLFRTGVGLGIDNDTDLNSPEFLSKGLHPTMVTVNVCKKGCIDGPGVDQSRIDFHNIIECYGNEYSTAMAIDDGGKLSAKEKYLNLTRKFSAIEPRDFEWEGEEDYHQKCSVPEYVVEEIFESMHKTSRVKKELNCQACGYRTCYEMVCAVANGYSRIEECVHYLNDEMKAQMDRDSLTGLLNQRGFFKAATRLVASNTDKKYVLILGDINSLGGLNDLYGNTGGDMVISYIAKTLEDFSDKRGLCSRMGAGVFGIIFENTAENMERFKKDTQLSISHLGMEYPLSVKFGMYVFNDLSVNIGRATLYATYAYRTVKDRSRNTYVYYTDEMSKYMSMEAEITQRMKSAMENMEFVLYYQPKYDHLSGQPVGAEALCRWIRPDGDIVSPGIFIPVFEKNGYITELDRFVWKSSFEAVTKWVQAGYRTIPVSVNISRISLLDAEIVPFIENLRNSYPEASGFIQFEITESAYAGNVEEIFERVEAIRRMGFAVNMDDFGSGYSSLNLLKDAPIDIVKLDMGFLRGEDRMGRGNVIISSVVNMTKQLGFDIIAEGVETRDQADLLAGMGCNVIQGYYYSRPMPEQDFSQLIKGQDI